MKINPVSFNKAQRPSLFWQEPGLQSPRQQMPDGAHGGGRGGGVCGAGSGGPRGRGAGLRSADITAGTRTLDKHPCRAERSDLENAIMYF